MEWYEGEAVEEGFLVDLPPYPDAETFLWGLIGPIEDSDNLRPNDIILMTARNCQHSVEATALSLECHNFPYEELHFCEAKWKVDCDVYIDDNPGLLHRFNKLGKELIIPTRPWTQHILGTFGTHAQIVAYVQDLCQLRSNDGY